MADMDAVLSACRSGSAWRAVPLPVFPACDLHHMPDGPAEAGWPQWSFFPSITPPEYLMSLIPPFVRHGLDVQQIPLPEVGITINVLIPAAASGGSSCMFEEVTGPGGGPPLHVHAGQDECFYFLEGSYLLHVDGKEWRVDAGDVAVVPRGTPHAFVNIGTTPGRLLFTLTPALEGEQFFLELAEVLKEGPPDPARLNRRFARMGFTVVGPPLTGKN